mgnify:CR=1 FL=1
MILSKKNENMESGDKIEKPGEKLKEIRVYYVDEMTGEVTGKTVAIRTEEDIWAALQETGILTTDCQLLNLRWMKMHVRLIWTLMLQQEIVFGVWEQLEKYRS